jgi:hypothetical protein
MLLERELGHVEVTRVGTRDSVDIRTDPSMSGLESPLGVHFESDIQSFNSTSGLDTDRSNNLLVGSLKITAMDSRAVFSFDAAANDPDGGC